MLWYQKVLKMSDFAVGVGEVGKGGDCSGLKRSWRSK
jgi:hypothetical protein